MSFRTDVAERVLKVLFRPEPVEITTLQIRLYNVDLDDKTLKKTLTQLEREGSVQIQRINKRIASVKSTLSGRKAVFRKGVELYSSNAIQETIDWFDQLHSLYPDGFAELVHDSLRIAIQKGRSRSDMTFGDWSTIANNCIARDRLDLAEAILKALIEYDLALITSIQHEEDEARKAKLEKQQQSLESSFARDANNLGVVYARRGERDDAEKWFGRSFNEEVKNRGKELASQTIAYANLQRMILEHNLETALRMGGSLRFKLKLGEVQTKAELEEELGENYLESARQETLQLVYDSILKYLPTAVLSLPILGLPALATLKDGALTSIILIAYLVGVIALFIVAKVLVSLRVRASSKVKSLNGMITELEKKHEKITFDELETMTDS